MKGGKLTLFIPTPPTLVDVFTMHQICFPFFPGTQLDYTLQLPLQLTQARWALAHAVRVVVTGDHPIPHPHFPCQLDGMEKVIGTYGLQCFVFFFLMAPPVAYGRSRWGVDSELQCRPNATAMPDPNCIYDLHCSLLQPWIFNPLS